jgi:hypothetical protein
MTEMTIVEEWQGGRDGSGRQRWALRLEPTRQRKGCRQREEFRAGQEGTATMAERPGGFGELM